MWLTNLCLTDYRLRGTVYHNTSYTYGGVYDNKRYYGAPIIKGVNKFMGGIFGNDKYNFYYIFVACTCINVCTGREQSV